MTVEKYLVIITTVLVLTQIIRLIQNAIQLHRQNKLFKAQLGDLEGVTNLDIQNQRKMHRLVIEYLEERKSENENEGCG